MEVDVESWKAVSLALYCLEIRFYIIPFILRVFALSLRIACILEK